MSKTQPNPEFVSLDVDQWRRNIHAFADTTRQALDAIADELSNHCAGGTPVRPLAAGNRESAQAKEVTPSPPPQRTLDPNAVDRPVAKKEAPNPKDAVAATDNRLSDLKNKLAQRLAKK